MKKYKFYMRKYHYLFYINLFSEKNIFYSKIQDSKNIKDIISERLVKELNHFICT